MAGKAARELVADASPDDTAVMPVWPPTAGQEPTKITVAELRALLRLLSSTDEAIARFDGTAGALQNSGVKIDDSDGIYGYRGKVVRVDGTTHTFDAADTGKVHIFDNASGCLATFESDIPADWGCMWIVKAGAGQLSIAVTGGTLHNRQSHTKSAGAKAGGTLYVESNAGTSPQVYLFGDTTA